MQPKEKKVLDGEGYIEVSPKIELSEGQKMIKAVFSGSSSWGTGQNLPKVEGKLITGGGIIKNGDVTRKTARMFGLKY
jgi:hypothetical protein